MDGDAAIASRIETALSMTPMPLCCPTTRYYCLNIRDRKRNERSMGKTLAEKLWDSHVVHSAPGEPDLLYIDMHLVHEVTSPQAFDGLRLAGRPVHRPDLTLATEDHNVPTQHIELPIADPVSRTQVEALRKNCAEFGISLYPMGNARPGHRARHRPAARNHPARYDDRLRRLPHVHARRVRRTGVRHRYEPGRARPRHADPADGPAEDDGGHGRRRTARGRNAEGRHPRDHRQDRHRWRAGLHGRVPRQHVRADVHGRPHDRLQHEHRMGRPRRHGRTGRDHIRLPARASTRPHRRAVGCGGRVLDEPAHRRRRRVRRARHPRR